jgi:hypothetical protein
MTLSLPLCVLKNFDISSIVIIRTYTAQRKHADLIQTRQPLFFFGHYTAVLRHPTTNESVFSYHGNSVVNHGLQAQMAVMITESRTREINCGVLFTDEDNLCPCAARPTLRDTGVPNYSKQNLIGNCRLSACLLDRAVSVNKSS